MCIINKFDFILSSSNLEIKSKDFDDNKNIIFLFPPLSGWGIVYENIIGRVENYSFYCFDFYENIFPEKLIDIYCHTIFKLSKNKSISIMGYSAGANIAFEVIKKLESVSIKIDKLIVLDAPLRDKKIIMDHIELKEFNDGFYNYLVDVGFIRKLKKYSKLDPDVLNNKIMKRHSTYKYFYNELINYGYLATDVYLIKSEKASDLTDKNIERWCNQVNGNVKIFSGGGDHFSMLSYPNVQKTLSTLKRIF